MHNRAGHSAGSCVEPLLFSGLFSANDVVSMGAPRHWSIHGKLLLHSTLGRLPSIPAPPAPSFICCIIRYFHSL
jgi:hypothetical protein